MVFEEPLSIWIKLNITHKPVQFEGYQKLQYLRTNLIVPIGIK